MQRNKSSPTWNGEEPMWGAGPIIEDYSSGQHHFWIPMLAAWDLPPLRTKKYKANSLPGNITVSICMKKDTGAFKLASLVKGCWGVRVNPVGITRSGWVLPQAMDSGAMTCSWQELLEDVQEDFWMEREREIWDEERDCSLVKQTCRKSHVPGFSNVAVLFRQFYLINIYFSLLYTVISVQLLEPSCWC